MNKLEDLREIKDGITELVDNFKYNVHTSSETILGYLTINGKRAQITLKAETDNSEWISD